MSPNITFRRYLFIMNKLKHFGSKRIIIVVFTIRLTKNMRYCRKYVKKMDLFGPLLTVIDTVVKSASGARWC